MKVYKVVRVDQTGRFLSCCVYTPELQVEYAVNKVATPHPGQGDLAAFPLLHDAREFRDFMNFPRSEEFGPNCTIFEAEATPGCRPKSVKIKWWSNTQFCKTITLKRARV